MLSDLRREKYLSPYLFMTSPPPRAHPGHYRPGRADITIDATYPSIFRRTLKLPAAGDEDTSPPVYGTGSPVKRGSRRASGPEGPHPSVYPRYQALNEELRQASRKLTGGEDPGLPLDGNWPRHIDLFERKYDKSFAKDPLFWADLMDRIHKRVQVFLQSCNTTFIRDVGSGALVEFG